MSRSFRNQFIASLNSGRRKSSEWSSAAGRGGKLPPPLVLRMWLLWLLCLEIERSGLMWKILMSLFQKLDFTNIKHTHPPEFMVAGLRPPKSLLRWGLNFPDEFNFLTDCLCEYPPPPKKSFFRSSWRNLCLQVTLMLHVMLVSEDIIYFTADW